MAARHHFAILLDLRPAEEGAGSSCSDLSSSKVPVLSIHRQRNRSPSLRFEKSVMPDIHAHAGFPRELKAQNALVVYFDILLRSTSSK